MGVENIWLIAIGASGIFISAVAYMIGGTSGFGEYGKAWRRFIGASVLALDANLMAAFTLSWNWLYLLMFPCLMIGFSLGYGAETTIGKIFKRSVYALGVLSACLCGFYASGCTLMGWVVIGLAFLTGASSVVLGVWNPYKNAPLEQLLISVALTMYTPWWAFIK